MITAVEPPSQQTRAFALSLALHAGLLALLAAFIPMLHANLADYGLRDDANVCVSPCGRVFAIRIERRARVAATAGIRRIAETLMPSLHHHAQSKAAEHPVLAPRTYHDSRMARESAPRALPPVDAELAVTGAAGTNSNISAVTPQPGAVAAASRLQPNTVSANPASGTQTPPSQTVQQVALGAANWGSHFDTPTLRDRTLYDDIVAKLPQRGKVTVVVDDQGHATDVRIDAPGLDPAIVADWRKRLLAALYAPVERDGVAFDGTLTISSSPAR